MNRISQILKPVLMVLAAIYLVADAVFMHVAKPLADWIGKRHIFHKFRRWISGLSPYAALGLFCVPLIVLEPAKPLSAYLVGTGHIVAGVSVFTVAEVLKLVLVERLFHISRSKLLSIPVFAWAYGRWRQAVGWIQSTDAWNTVRRVVRKTNFVLRSLVWQIRSNRVSYSR